MVSSSRSTRGGKSPRSLPDPVAAVSPPKQRPAKKIAAAKKKPKKTKAKKNTTVVRSRSSPAKEDQRYYGGSRTSSTGLCLRCIEAPSWARRDVDEGSGRHPGADR